MKKIKVNFFGNEDEIYFNIARIMEVEKLTGLSIGEIINNQKLNVTTLASLLMVGLKHTNYKKNLVGWAEAIEEAINRDVEITEIQIAVVKALIGSGIMGKTIYYQVFPEEKTPAIEAEIAKN